MEVDMALKNYGVLKGRPVSKRLGEGSSPHYQVRIIDETTDFRIAINVKSKESPSDLAYLIDDDFQHPILAGLLDLPLGFTELPRKAGGLALDFIRANLFDRTQMRPLPFNLPGPDNDLNEAIDKYVMRAMNDEDALVYAFGERWGPEIGKKDKYFGFLPGNGIHDIHMNQGNSPAFTHQDGVWQDGAMLIHLPTENRWVGVFLKFQSQAWHTDDVTGHALTEVTPVDDPSPDIDTPEPDLVVRIIAALVNPPGGAPEEETVTLLNTSPHAINMDGWKIADKMKNKHALSGVLKAGAALTVNLPSSVQLGNKGGIITLLDKQGVKIHGVSYTQEQAKAEGWTVVF
jgi:uncharacterized protein YukJ